MNTITIPTSTTKATGEGKIEWRLLWKCRGFLIMLVLSAQHFTNDPDLKKPVKGSREANCQMGARYQWLGRWHHSDWPFGCPMWTCPCPWGNWGGGGVRKLGACVTAARDPVPRMIRCHIPSPDQPGEQQDKKDVSGISGQISISPVEWGRGGSGGQLSTSPGHSLQRSLVAGSTLPGPIGPPPAAWCRQIVGAFQMCEGWSCFTQQPLCLFLPQRVKTLMKGALERRGMVWVFQHSICCVQCGCNVVCIL